MNENKNREKYEWARLWWEDAPNSEIPRILLIGDSITAGYRPIVNEILQGNVLVDQMASSGAINDSLFLKQISMMLTEYSYKAIHFNNGLHGWHIEIAEYEMSLKRIIEKILNAQDKTVLVLATTTPSTVKGRQSLLNPEKDIIIRERNSIVVKAADEYDLKINDLYSHVEGMSELRSEDGSHYTQHGYIYLAEKVADCIKTVL